MRIAVGVAKRVIPLLPRTHARPGDPHPVASTTSRFNLRPFLFLSLPERNRPPNPSLAAPDDASKPPRPAVVPPHYDAYEERRLAEEVLCLHSLWRSGRPAPASAPAPPSGGSYPTRARPNQRKRRRIERPATEPEGPGADWPLAPSPPASPSPASWPDAAPPPPHPSRSQSHSLPPPRSRSGTPFVPPSPWSK
ncbi:hypothetical protein ZWY2020_027883 [Hordeum vulgare]|nr:hypothetical protein ZWY2020_027883 [Hordeum vulgare]